MHFKKKFLLLFTICLVTGAAFISAQDSGRQSMAAEIETLLNTGAVSYAQAARFVLEASGALAASGHEEAFGYAEKQGWLPQNVSANEAARLDGISLLLMRSFNIQGGLMFTFFKNAHYAYQELAYLKIIPVRSDPAMLVSGDTLLLITGRILSRYMEN